MGSRKSDHILPTRREAVLTVYCERDTQKPGNVCVKCGTEWVAGTPLPACSAANALPALNESLNDLMRKADENAAAIAKPAPVKHCFPKFGGPFDMNTNPPSDKKYEICERCGNSWPHNSIPPSCPRNEAMVGFIPAKDKSFRDGEILATAPVIIETPKNTINAVIGLQPDEPFFILRASDLLADWLVERWAMNAETQGCHPDKVRAAREKAGEMRAWAGERKYPQ